MPSTMIHLLVAHEIEPEAPDFFWVGNFAPDYTNDRELKDKIHLRDKADRWILLDELYTNINKENSFERGWFLHLFVDTCWDEKLLIEYKNWFESINKDDNWFLSYRNEIGLATYYLYHNLTWSRKIWDLIKYAQLSDINTSLPITLAQNEWYRDRVVSKHSESDSTQSPKFFIMDKLTDFSQITVNRYKEWAAIHTK